MQVTAVHAATINSLKIEDARQGQHDQLHPAAALGVDPFEFCHLGRPGTARHPWHGRTLAERVIHFMDQYNQPAA